MDFPGRCPGLIWTGPSALGREDVTGPAVCVGPSQCQRCASVPGVVRPSRARWVFGMDIPGRCPGLVWAGPSALGREDVTGPAVYVGPSRRHRCAFGLGVVRPDRARWVFGMDIPGRCPGLIWTGPSALGREDVTGPAVCVGPSQCQRCASVPGVVRPYRARWVFGMDFPGRCPGLVWAGPSALRSEEVPGPAVCVGPSQCQRCASVPGVVRPYRARWVFGMDIPGRCPGLIWTGPSALRREDVTGPAVYVGSSQRQRCVCLSQHRRCGSVLAQGNALENSAQTKNRALKGRPNHPRPPSRPAENSLSDCVTPTTLGA